MKRIALLILLIIMAPSISAEVRPSSCFSSDMVIQQNSIFTLFGEAEAGEKIVISFSWSDVKEELSAGKDGLWEIEVMAPPAGGPFTMSFCAGDTVVFDNILSGEVWFAAGQSNMEMLLKELDDLPGETDLPGNNEIRFFSVPRQISFSPQQNPPRGGKWQVVTPQTAGQVSAVAYYFAEKLNEALNVPVGIIISAWGGTPAEAWIREEVLKSDALFNPVYERWAAWKSSAEADSVSYLKDLEIWNTDSINGIKRSRPEIPQSIYMTSRPHRQPSVLFNGMVRPFVRIPVKGVIWYQGTSNKEWHYEYEHLFRTLILSWRKEWRSDRLPLYFVQIAPYGYQFAEQGAGIREAQRRAMSMPFTGMVVTMDCGDRHNIHPTDKKTPGERLALWALSETYGRQAGPFSGPLYRSHSFEGDRVRLFFDYSGSGLASSDGEPLRHFSLGDANGMYYPAEAVIDGMTILLSSPSVAHPRSVKYACGNIFDANFINMEGLPASPFCTATDSIISSPRYFDASAGDDRNDGRSPFTAWKNIDTISSLKWGPGAEIKFKCGERWTGQLNFKGDGTGENPVKVTSYGDGPPPLIEGGGEEYTIMIENSCNWEIHNLEITNFGYSEEELSLDEWEKKNLEYWCKGKALPPFSEDRSRKTGIIVKANDRGEMSGYKFSNLEIHGINGDISSKDNGGIYFEITGSEKPTWFADITIEECHIHDVDRTGISNQSSWSERSLSRNINWVPSKNIIIRNNLFERTGANALIVRVSQNPVIEHNLFSYCAIKESGNASFSFNCDNAIWQYNEASFTKYNKGDADAGGFDSDYKSKNTIIRYNYSHHNEYGGILVCCMGGSGRFNTGTLVYYNLFVNNENHTIRTSGPVEGTVFLNNVIFNSPDDTTTIIWHKDWSGFSNSTDYTNNIFYIKGGVGLIKLDASRKNYFRRNIFYGKITGDAPTKGIYSDPLFTTSPLPDDPDPSMFRLSTLSPALNSGLSIKIRPYTDYFGNNITDADIPDIGIHEKQGR